MAITRSLREALHGDLYKEVERPKEPFAVAYESPLGWRATRWPPAPAAPGSRR